MFLRFSCSCQRVLTAAVGIAAFHSVEVNLGVVSSNCQARLGSGPPAGFPCEPQVLISVFPRGLWFSSAFAVCAVSLAAGVSDFTCCSSNHTAVASAASSGPVGLWK